MTFRKSRLTRDNIAGLLEDFVELARETNDLQDSAEQVYRELLNGNYAQLRVLYRGTDHPAYTAKLEFYPEKIGFLWLFNGFSVYTCSSEWKKPDSEASRKIADNLNQELVKRGYMIREGAIK